MPEQTVLFADDEAPMRKLVSANLTLGGYGVVLAADGVETLRMVAERPPDLLLLDLGLPSPDGFDVLQAVRRDLDLPVLVVSARAREGDKVRALDLGADDYLTKPFGAGELLARVRTALRRASRAPKGPPPFRCDGLEVDFGARQVRRNGVEVALTPREYEVLAYLVRNAGKMLTHRQILQAVWGSGHGDESDYVWTYVRRVRRKLEPDPEHPRYVLTVPGVGYRAALPSA